MGKKKSRALAACIYCNVEGVLTDEHVLPLALDGSRILKNASCAPCSVVTGALEQRLLRKAWLPHRKKLGMPSRRPQKDEFVPVRVISPDGRAFSAQLPARDVPSYLAFHFPPPSFLRGYVSDEVPSGQVMMLQVDPMPLQVYVDGVQRPFRGRLEVQVNLDASDVARAVAKVAHSAAIKERGRECCAEYFLPKYILGNGVGALTFVGSTSEPPTPKDPGQQHIVECYESDGLLLVRVQFFRRYGSEVPVYVAVVGRLRC